MNRTKNQNLLIISLILLVCVSCGVDNSDKEGFNQLSEVDYSLKYLQLNTYPSTIDKKISKEQNLRFSDSIRRNKVVFARIKYCYYPNTKKVKNIDTMGYFVSMRNDSIELFWEIDFDSDIKIIRSEELTFEKKKQFEKEGERGIGKSHLGQPRNPVTSNTFLEKRYEISYAAQNECFW